LLIGKIVPLGVAGHRGASTGTKAAAEFGPGAMDFLALSVLTYGGAEEVQTPILGRAMTLAQVFR